MPGRTRKRKHKRRKPSSRKRARRRRPAPRPPVHSPSSDEDFVLDGDGEESSAATDSEDSDEEDASDEEEEEAEDDSGDEVLNFDENLLISGRRRRHPSRVSNGLENATPCLAQPPSDEDFIADIENSRGFEEGANHQSAPSRPHRCQRHRGNELDEDFDVHAQIYLEDNGIGREGLPGARASRARRLRSRQNLSDVDLDIEAERVLANTETSRHANRATHLARVRRRHHRQKSSDEDFEADMEMILESSLIGSEGAVASRPMTRARDSCLVSDLHEGGAGKSLSDSGSLQQAIVRGIGAGEPSPQEAGGGFGGRNGGTVLNDAEIDKRKGKGKVLEGEESTSIFFASETSLSNTKASNDDEETPAVVCGICLAEMVVAERGKLDSCDHFFCFGCIMEWAKVESRCPMCKQRFTIIAKSGTGKAKRTRKVRIPLRDQIYIPPEEPDLPPEDPFADIVCMECHGTGDEGLLLLCDYCDSAAHTFCVGLGRSVPRGDWYCRECQALIGWISGSEDEAEHLVSGSSEEEDDDDDDEFEDDERESILRTIVASANPGSQHPRQTRVRRRSFSASRSRPSSRNVTGRRLQQVSRRQRGTHTAAPRPRLSQAARALLSSTSAELNQAPLASVAPQNGSARTVPQQRRLHERINEMRNNWGRIQNGDLQFDALRGATRPVQPAVLSNSNGAALRTGATGPAQPAVSSTLDAAPIPGTPSFRTSVSEKKDVDSVEQPESSTQRDKDVQRAWQMMDHAQHLSAGIGSSKLHRQKLGALPSSSTLSRGKQSSKNSATSNLAFARKNLEIPTCRVPSTPLENGNIGLYEPESTPIQVSPNLKHDEISLRQRPRPTTLFALTSVAAERRREELPCSSNSMQPLAACTSPTGFDKDSVRPAGGKDTGSLNGFKPESLMSSRHFDRKDAGILQNLPEDTRMKDNRDVSGARETVVAMPSSSTAQEGLKVHLTELVKRQTWPVYLAERLDKEQFKRIARTAVHSLLALCNSNIKSESLSCVHLEDRGNDPVLECCKKCLDRHVEKAVKNAKEKVIPR